MRKLLFTLIILTYTTNAFAFPARLGGYSFHKDENGVVLLDDEGSIIYNEGPPALQEDLPEYPFYLTEDSPGLSKNFDKYETIPTYKESDIYNKNFTYKQRGKIEKNNSDDEDEDFNDDEDEDFNDDEEDDDE